MRSIANVTHNNSEGTCMKNTNFLLNEKGEVAVAMSKCAMLFWEGREDGERGVRIPPDKQ